MCLECQSEFNLAVLKKQFLYDKSTITRGDIMKKLFSILLIFASFLIINTSYAEGVRVEINSLEIEFDQPAIISENRTLVPFRKIFEVLGADVEWIAETGTAVSQKDGKVVSITIGSNELYINNEPFYLDVPARIVNNRTLVPLRAISEAYDCVVDWRGEERLAEIFSKEFAEASKTIYQDENGVSFEYFSDCELIKGNGVITLKSGACIMTVRTSQSGDIEVNDEYIEELKRGLGAFSEMEIKYTRKMAGKNIARIGCYNRGNTIYYTYAVKNGVAYDLAVTIPDLSEQADAEKLMYAMNDFSKNF